MGQFQFVDVGDPQHRKHVRSHAARRKKSDDPSSRKDQAGTEEANHKTQARCFNGTARSQRYAADNQLISKSGAGTTPDTASSYQPERGAWKNQDVVVRRQFFSPTSHAAGFLGAGASSIQSAEPTRHHGHHSRSGNLPCREGLPSSTTWAKRWLNRHTTFPRTNLGPSRTDPFQTFPVQLTLEDHQLVDHYLSVIPAKLFPVRMGSKMAFNPFLDIMFAQCMLSPLSFRFTILTLASVHLQHMRLISSNFGELVHHFVESEQTIVKKTAALSTLREHIAYLTDSKVVSDDIIWAVLAVSCLEDRWGNFNTSWLHLRAAMGLIEKRGGIQTLGRNHRLATYTVWVDYTMAGPPPQQGVNLHKPLSPQTADSPFEVDPGMEDLIDEVVELLSNFGCLSHIHYISSLEDKDLFMVDTHCSRRTSIFEQGSTIYKLLAALPLNETDESGFFDRVRESCRFAALIYINFVLWDLRHSLESTEAFLGQLARYVIDNDLDYNWSVELFLWLLVASDVANPSSSERPWQVSKYLRLIKRLNMDGRMVLGQKLLACLEMSHGTEECGAMDNEYLSKAKGDLLNESDNLSEQWSRMKMSVGDPTMIGFFI